MAYSQKVVDKFEQTLKTLKRQVLVDGSLEIRISIELEQVLLVHLLVEML